MTRAQLLCPPTPEEHARFRGPVGMVLWTLAAYSSSGLVVLAVLCHAVGLLARAYGIAPDLLRARLTGAAALSDGIVPVPDALPPSTEKPS